MDQFQAVALGAIGLGVLLVAMSLNASYSLPPPALAAAAPVVGLMLMVIGLLCLGLVRRILNQLLLPLPKG